MSRFSIACPRINSKHAFSGRNGCENFDAETGLRYGLDDLIAFFQDAFFSGTKSNLIRVANPIRFILLCSIP